MGKTDTSLLEQLQALDDKAEWEGGITDLVLDYGGVQDLFPSDCWDACGRLQEAADDLHDLLRELSLEAGYLGRSW